MPIFNASVTGEGGGQGGGDKVTALVGSNASGIDVGDKVILNYPAAQDIQYTTPTPIGNPIYFDGQFLVSTGGRFSANSDGTLTYLGSSGIDNWAGSHYSVLVGTPPNYLSDGSVMFSINPQRGVLYVKDGSVSGSLPYHSDDRSFISDCRFDSTKSGFSFQSCGYSGSGIGAAQYWTNGAYNTSLTTNVAGTILSSSGNTYMLEYTGSSYHNVKQLSWNGSSISATQVFTTTALISLGVQRGYNLACCTSKQDDYTFWYQMDKPLLGFTKLDIANSSISVVTPPAALSVIKGNVWKGWWDLDNRFYVETSVGIYVFSYTNHDISTMTLLKKFEWDNAYFGGACISPSLRDFSVGNYTSSRAYSEGTIMPIYEFSANVYNNVNFSSTSLTGFVNAAITTDPYGQSIVEVNTVKDPADTWTNVGTPFGFDVSTTSSDVSVGRGYYNSGSAEVIIPATVTKTIAQIGTNQTLGYKNDIYVYRDTSDVCSDLMCKTGTTPVGTFKVSTALTTPVYLSPDKTVIMGTDADSGFDVSYEAEHATQTNYTVVGSPTIDSNYVASGFSDSNYLNIGKFLPGNSAWEAIFKVKTPLSITRQNLLVGAISNYAGCGFAIELNSGKRFGVGFTSSNVWDWDIGWISSSFVVQEDTDYWVKVYFTGSSYHLALSTDGILYTDLGSLVSSSKIISNPQDLQLGTTSSSSNCWSGSIDLKECYMNVNGETVWRGAIPATNGSVTVGEGYSYIDETDAPFYLDSDLTRSATQMVVHPEDFVEVPYGPPVEKFTITGSPTITDGIISFASSSDYIVSDTQFPSSGEAELLIKFYISGPSNWTKAIVARNGSSGSIGIFSDNSLSVYDNGWHLTNLTVSTGKTYWAKYIVDIASSQSYLYAIEDNGYTKDTLPDISLWPTYLSWSSSGIFQGDAVRFGLDGQGNTNTSFDIGSIDLNECYIKSNGSVVWQPYGSGQTVKQGTLFLTQPTAGTTSSVVSANATPTAAYVGSVVDPIDMGKTVTMDTTLTKILDVS